MSTAKFTFDRAFQMDILALMRQRYDFLVMCDELITPECFEDKILQWFFNNIKSYYDNYKECPDTSVVDNELRKAAAAGIIKPGEMADYAYVSKHLRKNVQSKNYVIDEVVRFCRRQAGRQVYIETAAQMDTAGEDEWDKILDKINHARNIGVSYLDQGTWFFKDAASRAQRRSTGATGPLSVTGIKGIHPKDGYSIDIDIKLGGGLQKGQMGIWMGGTGAGKSIALAHVGKRAVTEGQKVVHYTLELNEAVIADRYDSNWSGVNFQDIKHQPTKVVDAIQNLANSGYDDRLLIKSYPSGGASVNTIKAHLRQLHGGGWEPDLIIVDYIDVMKPTTSYKDQYQDLGVVALNLRGLAEEVGVPLWTASQVNRGGLGQDIIDIEHIGDSLKKAQVADVVIALCQTKLEKGLTPPRMRLFMAKNRNGPDKFECEIFTAYEQMTLYAGPATSSAPTGTNAKK